MSDRNIDAINNLMLSNPMMNPYGYLQHAANPTAKANELDNPLLVQLTSENNKDSFEKQDTRTPDINFKGSNTKFNANYSDYLKKKSKNGFILSLLGTGTILSSFGAYKFSEFGKKNPWIMFALGVIGTVGNLVGLSEVSSANKEFLKYKC